MIGAIAGDTIGSAYEWNNIKTKQFDLFSPDCFFTDDTVPTVALAEMFHTGFQYTPVDSMATCVTPHSLSQSASRSRSWVKVAKLRFSLRLSPLAPPTAHMR